MPCSERSVSRLSWLAIALGSTLPLLGGCVVHSFDPRVPEEAAADTVVAAEASSTDDSDGLEVALTSSLPSGRLVSSSRVTVIEPNAQRRAARFESPTGAAQFERSVAERYADGAAVRARVEGGIPWLLASEERRMLSENAFYNVELGRADADRNGELSDAEVIAYRHTPPPRLAR
jgi:hypothetical protein